MKRSGQADLPLHHGRVPPWLFERMSRLGRAIMEFVVEEYGTAAALSRLSDPHWFQSLGAAMGMDWHSSGITTSVMGALKRSVNPISHDLGLFICGGRGRYSRKTPDELMAHSERTGSNGDELVRLSRLTAKVDNTSIQDGYQLYLHNFVVSRDGQWTVIQQGMNHENGMARRYHWHSGRVRSFVEEPHAAICGRNAGEILNLTDKLAAPTRRGILQVAGEHPEKMVREAKKMVLPARHAVTEADVDLRRLGSVLAMAYEAGLKDFESLLLLRGLGPKTLRSLTLVSEVIHGTPSRFRDPARFSFAHGGKDGHPHPVQTHVYDQTLDELQNALDRARLGYSDKKNALKKLSEASRSLEKNFRPHPGSLQPYTEKERDESHQYGGRTAFGWSVAPSAARSPAKPKQADRPKGKDARVTGKNTAPSPGKQKKGDSRNDPRQLRLF